MVTFTEISRAVNDFQLLDAAGSRKKFWYLAHQSAAYSIPQILDTLSPSNRRDVTVRNSMEYRYLGLLAVEAKEVKDTTAGLALMDDDGSNLQTIIDCQIAKFWLSNPTNNRLKIDAYPLFVAGKILSETGYLNWSEYLTVVIWVQSHSDIKPAINLIHEIRKFSFAEQESLLKETKAMASTKDLGDQARRPWKLISNHSLVKLDGVYTLRLATSNKEATDYLDAIERSIPSKRSSYESYLLTPLNLPPVVINNSSKDAGLSFREVLLKPRLETEPKYKNVVRPPRHLDYDSIQKARNEAGQAAEIYVFNTERNLLSSLGLTAFAESVERLSLVDDGLGYDILSFETDGTEKHIEVKSVSKIAGNCSIFISANEVRTAQADPNWVMYVVMGNGSTKPYIWDSEELTQAIRDLDVSATQLREQIFVSAPQLELSFFVLDSTDIV